MDTGVSLFPRKLVQLILSANFNSITICCIYIAGSSLSVVEVSPSPVALYLLNRCRALPGEHNYQNFVLKLQTVFHHQCQLLETEVGIALNNR